MKEMVAWVASVIRDEYPDHDVFESEYSSWIAIRRGVVYVTFNGLCRVDGSEFYLTVDDKSQRRVFASSGEARPVGFETRDRETFLRNFRVALKEAYEDLEMRRDEMSRELVDLDKRSDSYELLRKKRNYYTRFMRKYREMWWQP